MWILFEGKVVVEIFVIVLVDNIFIYYWELLSEFLEYVRKVWEWSVVLLLVFIECGIEIKGNF